MQLAILHLSDIHFQASKRFVTNRTQLIAQAISGGNLSWTNLLVAVSGDVAFAGTKSQYAIAAEFLGDLNKKLLEASPGSTIRIVVVPGNHDCDYSTAENTTRSILLSHLNKNIKDIAPDAQPLRHLLAVQENFEEFRRAVAFEPGADVDATRIAQTLDVPFGSEHVRVSLYNTALACERRTQKGSTDQGNLFLPPQMLQQGSFSTADSYAITVLHHPLEWLESNNGLEVKRLISGTSDLVLMGHQHQEEAERREWINTEKNLWVRAATLQDETGSSSGFNLLMIDTALLVETVYQYKWNGELYAVEKEQSWTKTEEQRTNRRQFPLTSQARLELDDPGTGFTHPSKKTLHLDDLFVHPTLIPLLGTPRTFLKDKTADGSDVPPDLTAQKLTLVLGEARSGKTILAKHTFKKIYDSNDNATPLIVFGAEINTSHLGLERLWRLIERAYRRTYLSKHFDAYTQLQPGSRVLIIDDWQLCQLNDVGKNDVLQILQEKFSAIVLFADDTVKVENTGGYTDKFLDAASFSAYKIQPFGHLLRAKLIRKWLVFSREAMVSNKSLHDEITRAEAIINTVMGKSLMPSYPFFVFSLLQVDQNINSTNHANGSYGYLYESLITMALAEVSQQSTEIDVYYMVLGRLANELYRKQEESVSPSELRAVIDDYAKEYKSIVDSTDLVNKLLRAKLIMFVDQQYSFRYKYIFCFFMARFLADQLKTPESAKRSREVMLELADTIAKEDNANIVIFLIYFTRDTELIDRLIVNAQRLFEFSPLFDADTSLLFLAPAIERHVKVDKVVVRRSPEDNRDTERNQLDTIAANEQADRDSALDDVGPNSDFVRAIKLLDILGQTVRNFPGSMPGNTKVRITGEVYKLGLRVLSATVSTIAADIERFRSFIKKGIVGSERAAKGREWTPEELEKKTDQLMVVLTMMITFGIVKTVTSAVGLAQLRPTYDEVKDSFEPSPAIEIIDLSISLDHGVDFPKAKILKLLESFRGKWFGRMLLNRLVGYHFMMFHVERSIATSVGDKLGLDMQMPEITSRLALGKQRTDGRS